MNVFYSWLVFIGSSVLLFLVSVSVTEATELKHFDLQGDVLRLNHDTASFDAPVLARRRCDQPS